MFQKVSEQLVKDSSAIQEVKLTEIEDKLNTELAKRREIERKLIILNEQIKNQKYLEHNRRIAHYI